MSLADLIREALRALESNRGRSLLTVLGIVIGISAVIAMTSLIGGVQKSLLDSMGLNAARLVYLNTSAMMEQKHVDRLLAAMPEYEAVEGSVSGYTQLSIGDEQWSVGITGGSPTFFEMTGQVSLSSGRLFTENEEEAASRVAVIGRSGVRALFDSPDADVLGKTITLNGRGYTIVGIHDDTMLGGGDGYFNAFMPASTVTKDFNGGVEMLGQVIGLVREGMDADVVAEDTKAALGDILGFSEDEIEDNIWPYTAKSSIDAMNSFMGAFQLIMGSVAGISLLVGGIGIMNMMLTNVTERIREIGVRRALGATRADITRQFLTESAVVCVTGGIIGVVFGYLVSWVLSLAASSMNLMGTLGGGEGMALTPAISLSTVALAVGLSIGIGLLFGYYPARRASRLDPVECLRYQ